MKSLIRTPINIEGIHYEISILLSGDLNKRYTTEWERSGDPKRTQAKRNFTNVHDAKKFAVAEISKAERLRAREAAAGNDFLAWDGWRPAAWRLFH